MSTATKGTAIDPPRLAHADEVLAALTRLRTFGMDLAQSLVDAVNRAEDASSAADAALAYSRIARAVRLTCALELRVAEEAAGIRDDEAHHRHAARAQALAARREAGFRAKEDVAFQVGMIVEEAATDLAEGEAEPLREGIAEWLHDQDEDERFADLSQAEMLESICQALNLTPDPKLWAAGQLVEAIEAAILSAGSTPGRRTPSNRWSFATDDLDRRAPRSSDADRPLEPADPP